MLSSQAFLTGLILLILIFYVMCRWTGPHHVSPVIYFWNERWVNTKAWSALNSLCFLWQRYQHNIFLTRKKYQVQSSRAKIILLALKNVATFKIFAQRACPAIYCEKRTKQIQCTLFHLLVGHKFQSVDSKKCHLNRKAGELSETLQGFFSFLREKRRGTERERTRSDKAIFVAVDAVW